MLIEIAPAIGRKHGKRMAYFKCSFCDTTVLRRADQAFHQQSCGCMRGGHFNHGQSQTRLYEVWEAMIARCKNTKHQAYKFYGARGIRVCREWEKFLPFYEWAQANGYNDTLTIDRLNSKGDYTPENCRFVTKAENTRRMAHEQIQRSRVTKPILDRMRQLVVEGIPIKDIALMYNFSPRYTRQLCYEKYTPKVCAS